MSHELVYFLKVNVAIALFYAFYRLFFYKDTFLKWRRAALLCFFGLSILYPLLNIQEWIKEQEPIVAMADMYSTVILPEITIDLSDEASQTDWMFFIVSSLKYIYWGVAGLLIIRLLVQLWETIRIGLRTPTVILQNTKVHLLDKVQGPFSFFQWIFIYPDSHTERETEEILIHEQTHASQWHSMDVLFSELTCILCWFNPFIWLMKREIRNNLEFLADRKVLETGYDCKTYQYHLLGLAHQKSVATLYNSFNVIPLKNRILMMNKKRTKQIGRAKYLIFLPLAALLLVVSNIEAIARSTEKFMHESPVLPTAPQQEKKYLYKGVVVDINGKPIDGINVGIEGSKEPAIRAKNGEFSIEWKDKISLVLFNGNENGERTIIRRITRNSNSPDRGNMRITFDESTADVIGIGITPQGSASSGDGEAVFEVADQMPEFPGGNTALMKFFSDNIVYPEAAQKNKTQGRTVVRFVVSKEGDVKDPIILRSISPELDEEAIRVTKLMPKWKPGKYHGKDVAVKYTIPVVFRAQ